MSATENDTALDGDAAALLATLVGANVDHLAHLNDALLKMEQRETAKYAAALVALCDALAAIPDFARSVAVDDALARASYRADVGRTLLMGGTRDV